MLIAEQVASNPLDESNSFVAYQSNVGIGITQQKLVNDAIFTDSIGLSVYVGDILYDRLSNNQVAMAQLLTKMHEHGVVIILGNHDIYADANRICTSDKWYKYERGCYASVPLSEEQATEVRNTVFVNSYFDPQNNILYSHYGVNESDTPPGSLKTGFGLINDYQNHSTDQIASYMNANQPIDHVTNYRPTNAQMELVDMYYNNRMSAIIHGHDSIFDYSSKKVIGINARTTDASAYIAVGIELTP